MKCNNCGSPNIKHIPAGVSKKTGKPYQAFSVCEDCKAGQNAPRDGVKQKTISPVNSEVISALREVFGILTHIEKQNEEILFELQSSKENLNPDNITFG